MYTADENLNDIGGDAVAYTNVWKVLVHSCVAYTKVWNVQVRSWAFAGQTPDEMYFGTAADLPTELAVARSQARAARLAANRAMSCDRCIGRPADLPAFEIPP